MFNYTVLGEWCCVFYNLWDAPEAVDCSCMVVFVPGCQCVYVLVCLGNLVQRHTVLKA